MKHEKVEMERTGRSSVMSRPTAGYRRGKRIWFRDFTCPVCGNIKSPPESTSKGKKFYCDGTRLGKTTIRQQQADALKTK